MNVDRQVFPFQLYSCLGRPAACFFQGCLAKTAFGAYNVIGYLKT